MTTDSNIPSGGLFEDIPLLGLDDTLYQWFLTTNKVISAITPLAIYDTAGGNGIGVSTIDGIATINVAAGCGLGFDSALQLTLDIESLDEANPADDDVFVFEKENSTEVTTDITDCEKLFKVKAKDILPATVAGVHEFTGDITFSGDVFQVDSPTVKFKSSILRIGDDLTHYTNTDQFGTDDTPRYPFLKEIEFAGLRQPGSDANADFGFLGAYLAWFSNQNLGLASSKAFVTDTAGGTGVFNFAPYKSQTQTQLNFLLGNRSTNHSTSGPSLGIRGTSATSRFDFVYTDAGGVETTLAYLRRLSGGDSPVLFYVGGKIYIEDLELSEQFLTTNDYTAYKVPLTSSDGVVDCRFTNRYVTEDYDPAIVVGDVVALDSVEDTNDTVRLIRAELADMDGYHISEIVPVLGIVERISDGKCYVALGGEFIWNGATPLRPGKNYYLKPSDPGKVVDERPSDGSLVVPVFVAKDTNRGFIYTAGALQPTVAYDHIELHDIDDNFLYELAPSELNKTLVLRAGANISLTKLSSGTIQITAGTLEEADYFKSITTDVGNTIHADGPADTLRFTGSNGITTSSNTNGSVTIEGSSSYGRIQVLGQQTGEDDYLMIASEGGDTLVLKSGIGINIFSNTNNELTIEATGLSSPADRSITSAKLALMNPYSVKGANGDGIPTDITLPVLADHYDVSVDTDGTTIFVDPDTLIAYPSITSDASFADGTPNAIAGFVLGRVLDEAGNVSPLKALNRAELRVLLGASPEGYIEESNTLFNEWYIFDIDTNGDPYSDATYTASAQSKNGNLNFIAGYGITMTLDTAGGEAAIRIEATGDTAKFGIFKANDTGETLNANITSGILAFNGVGAVGVDISTNNDVNLYIRSHSITNAMLDIGTNNSVKSVVGSAVVDIEVGTNQIIGRASGNLKSLTAEEARGVLGLSGNQFFKKARFYNGPVYFDIDADSNERVVFESGSNITFVQDGNVVRIVGNTDAGSGVKTLAFTRAGNIYTAPSQLTFDTLQLNSAAGLYNNLDIIPSTSNGGANVTATFDLGVMPACSVKLAGTTYSASRGGYLASNLVLPEGTVLGRVAGGTSLVAVPFADIITHSDLKYFKKVKVGANELTAGNGSTLTFLAGAGIDITLGGTTLTFSAATALVTDETPQLGGDLEIGDFALTIHGRATATFENLGSGSANSLFHFVAGATYNEIKVLRDYGATANIDLRLTPYGSGGYVVMNRLSSGASYDLLLKTTATHYFESGSATKVILSATADKDLVLRGGDIDKDVVFEFTDGVDSNKILARSSGNDTGFVTSNLSGNLVLVAGSNGTGLGAGSQSIQMNSDVLLAYTKTLKSSDNILRLEATDYLKLAGSSLAALTKIFKITMVTGTSRVIDTYNLAATGSAVKYIVHARNTTNGKDQVLYEFNILAVDGVLTVTDVAKSYGSLTPSNTQHTAASATIVGSNVLVSLNTISGNYYVSVSRMSLV